MILLSHLYKTYPESVHALKNINLKIDKGEFVYITGPSGAGKTTLFKMISAFDRPTSGNINILNYQLEKLNKIEVPFLRRKIGVVFQDFKLLSDRSVFENIALPLRVLGLRESHLVERVNEITELVGLSEKKHTLPQCLSGGEQQRTAIARALVHKPGLLIADEPTGNLDPQLSLEIMELFERANAQGTTVIIATHDHNFIKPSKRHLHISNGIISEGIPNNEIRI